MMVMSMQFKWMTTTRKAQGRTTEAIDTEKDVAVLENYLGSDAEVTINMKWGAKDRTRWGLCMASDFVALVERRSYVITFF